MARDGETGTKALARELARLPRRAARQKRKIESGSDSWQEWSATMEEIVSPIQRLVVRPADHLESLAAKFKAILWLIEVDESLLDNDDLGRLGRFGRDLAVLNGGA